MSGVFTYNGKILLTQNRKALALGGGRLPPEYQEVEWIGSSGTQYINTNFTPQIGDTFDLSFYRTRTTTNYETVFSAGTVSQLVLVLYRTVNLNYYRYFTSGGSAVTLTEIQTNEKTTVSIGSTGAITYNGKTNTTEVSKTKVAVNTTLRLFHQANDTRNFQGRIYKVTVKRNNADVCVLVPCYLISDSTIGMYDTISGVFYTNAGTGTFTKGADI